MSQYLVCGKEGHASFKQFFLKQIFSVSVEFHGHNKIATMLRYFGLPSIFGIFSTFFFLSLYTDIPMNAENVIGGLNFY